MRLTLILLFLQLWGNVDLSLSQDVCSGPPNIPHASVTQETKKAQYVHGDVIFFTCETGYVSGPSIKYACTDEGWLLLRGGTCNLKPCELPSEIPNGYYGIIKGEDFVFGAVIQYFCNEGYHITGEPDTRTCQLNKWTNHVPVCKPLSCNPPPVDDGPTVKGLTENDEPILPGRSITISCDVPGKKLNGSSVLVCGKDGQWNKPFPTCEDATCEVDVIIPPLRVTGLASANKTLKPGHVLHFYCDNEYTLDGSQQILCLQSGEWNTAFPTCSDKCKVPDLSANVQITSQYAPGSQVGVGQKLTFTCRGRGRYLQGNEEVACLANGQWSGPFPTCGEPVGCGRPPSLPDGDIRYSVKNSYEHREKVEYVCQTYHIMEGKPYKTCFSGRWTGDMKCLRPCTVNRDDMNRHNIEFKHTYENKLYSTHSDHLTFRCISGTVHDKSLAMRQRCVDGVITLPTCVSLN